MINLKQSFDQRKLLDIWMISSVVSFRRFRSFEVCVFIITTTPLGSTRSEGGPV